MLFSPTHCQKCFKEHCMSQVSSQDAIQKPPISLKKEFHNLTPSRMDNRSLLHTRLEKIVSAAPLC